MWPWWFQIFSNTSTHKRFVTSRNDYCNSIYLGHIFTIVNTGPWWAPGGILLINDYYFDFMHYWLAVKLGAKTREVSRRESPRTASGAEVRSRSFLDEYNAYTCTLLSGGTSDQSRVEGNGSSSWNLTDFRAWVNRPVVSGIDVGRPCTGQVVSFLH